MQLFSKFNTYFVELAVYAGTVVRILLNILLLVIAFALAVGVFKTGYDLFTSIGKPLEELFQIMLIDIVFIIALTEVAITVQAYLKDGAVHVRYIVDTILIIMLKEILVLWFDKPKLQEVVSICLIIAVLALIRISVTRFAPPQDSQ